MTEPNLLKSIVEKDLQLEWKNSLHGIEREALRIEPDGSFSPLDHPRQRLGHPLFHPYITLDCAEAQPELVTPCLHSELKAYEFMQRLHAYFYPRMPEGELLWPYSFPTAVEDWDKITLSNFGTTDEGIMRDVYHVGTSVRYPRSMLFTSGVHYNFSFSLNFWEGLRQIQRSSAPLQDFINEQYLAVSRNLLRLNWLITYLFGATPVLDRSYFNEPPDDLARLNDRTLFGEHATTIRMSEVGFFSPEQSERPISFNNWEEYTQDFHHCLTTPHPHFTAIGLFNDERQIQLNDHILQLPGEQLTAVRPRTLRLALDGDFISHIKKTGLRYIEFRSLDVDPFDPYGVNLERMYFMHAWALHCLIQPSPLFNDSVRQEARSNQNRVALHGREPGLHVQVDGSERPLADEGASMLEKVLDVAEVLDSVFGKKVHARAVKGQAKKLRDVAHTPSAKFLAEAKEEGDFVPYCIKLAKRHEKEIKRHPLPPKQLAIFNAKRNQSIATGTAQELLDAQSR